MVEIAGAHHQDTVAMSRERQHGGDKGLITARGDLHFTVINFGIVNLAYMIGIGAAKFGITLNRPVTRQCRIRCPLGQCRQNIGMRRIAGNSLTHINQRPVGTIIR